MIAAAPPISVLAAQAGEMDASARASFAGRAGALAASAGSGATVLVTCHRVEVITSGPAETALADLAGSADGVRLFRGADAVRHVLRLAAGLESAVLGEDEILHQVRELLESVRRTDAPDTGLARLLEIAIAVGRRARADAARPQERSLADRVLRVIEERGVNPTGRELLVVGSGVMGRALAVAAGRRGARVVVGSRTIERARATASIAGGRSVDLRDAARLAPTCDAVLVALSGPWSDLAPADPSSLPVVVDLSSPPAVPAVVRSALGARFVDVDGLVREEPVRAAESRDVRRAYVRHAESLVEAALERYLTWAAARGSAATLRTLRERAEAERIAELARLMRRLPRLDPRERELVAAFSERLVAGLLHRPTANLHEDADGSAAAAARLLFDL